MKPNEFMKLVQSNTIEDVYPPTDAQLGLNILIKHFLGDDWQSKMICNAQVNTEAIYEILLKYQKKESFIKRLFKG